MRRRIHTYRQQWALSRKLTKCVLASQEDGKMCPWYYYCYNSTVNRNIGERLPIYFRKPSIHFVISAWHIIVRIRESPQGQGLIFSPIWSSDKAYKAKPVDFSFLKQRKQQQK